MNFEELTLVDLAAPQKNAIVGGPFGSNLVSKDYVAAGVPVIRGANMGEMWVGGEFVYVSDEKAMRLSSNIAVPNDLVFTQRGTLGQVAIVPKHGYDRYIVSQSQMKITVDPKKADVRFLYYLFNSPDQLQYIRNSAIQTGVPHTNLGILKQTPVRIPPLETQKEVASVLGTLDDGIALLRETNATLEAIARALFKSWFVDFDPVQAKQEGRVPEAMDDATAALFPDSFTRSALGLVPDGWRFSTLGENASYLNRGISPKYVDEGGVVVINQKCIRDFTLDLSKSRRHDPMQRKINGRELCDGDILVNSTGVGTLGRVAQMLSHDEPMIVDSHVTVVRAGESLTWNYLGLFMMEKQGEIESLGEGSTGQTELSRSRLMQLLLVVPPKEILYKFDQIVVPLRQKFSANIQQIRTLSILRDTLLPRLISGQLRLVDSLAPVEEAT